MSKTLYVRHSGQAMDLSAIADLFTMVGDVERSQMEAKTGVFEMSTEEQARDCAERYHGHVFNGQALSVKLNDSISPVAPLVKLNRKKGI